MYDNPLQESRRQLEICNACRYCENLCAVFPAVHQRRSFADSDIELFADLCHNCRGCYYACQYVAPHEFALNLPAALAEVRDNGWQRHAFPRVLGRAFQRSGAAIAIAAVVGLALMLAVIALLQPASGNGFYGLMSHQTMVAIFLPAFVLPLITIGISLRRYWRSIDGNRIGMDDSSAAIAAAATLRHLDGGHGDGCNYEDEDRFSNLRRWLHQATMYGFLLCFAATSVATLMHYGLNMPAPYPFWSAPKLLGVSGGIALCVGTAGLGWLKLKADPELGARDNWGGEMGFILLLFLVSVSGLALYWLGDSQWLTALLALHLGSVLAFFLLMPYTKMVHGFYRLAALMKDAADKRLKTTAARVAKENRQ